MTRKGAAQGGLTHLNICVRKYNCKNVLKKTGLICFAKTAELKVDA